MSAKLFKIGQILRYGEGETALMRVTYISRNHGGSPARYYGQQCMGGSCGAYHENVELADAKDRKKWFAVGREYKRKPFLRAWLADASVVGRVED